MNSSLESDIDTELKEDAPLKPKLDEPILRCPYDVEKSRSILKVIKNIYQTIFDKKTRLEEKVTQKQLESINNKLTITKHLIPIFTDDSIHNDIILAAIEITYKQLLELANQFIQQLKHDATPNQHLSPDFTTQTALCKALRYYTGSRSETRIPQQIRFRDLLSGSHSEMRSETARRRSFQGHTEVSPKFARRLACAGFYMSRDGQIRCAFCQGSLGLLTHDGESPRQAHSVQFATCPILLGMDVGNEADAKSDDEDVKTTSDECSEPSITDEASIPESEAELRALAMSDGRNESQRWRQSGSAEAAVLALTASPLSLPAAATARAAMGERAVRGIEALERRASELPVTHPTFTRSWDRLNTLGDAELGQPADEVAEAGFFRCLGGDEAASGGRELACFSCGLRLSAGPWIGDAWTTHATWSPRCGHVLSVRGAAFVRRVRDWGVAEVVGDAVNVSGEQRCLTQMRSAVQNYRASPSLGIRYRVEARDFRARLDAPSARGVVRLGFSEVEVRVAMELRLVAMGDDFATSEQLLACVMLNRDTMTRNCLNLDDFRECQLLQLTLCARDVIDRHQCVACETAMTARALVILLPCDHKVQMCRQCADKCQVCPTCGTIVTSCFSFVSS